MLYVVKSSCSKCTENPKYMQIFEHITILHFFNYFNVFVFISKVLTEIFHTSKIYKNTNHDKTHAY